MPARGRAAWRRGAVVALSPWIAASVAFHAALALLWAATLDGVPGPESADADPTLGDSVELELASSEPGAPGRAALAAVPPAASPALDGVPEPPAPEPPPPEPDPEMAPEAAPEPSSEPTPEAEGPVEVASARRDRASDRDPARPERPREPPREPPAEPRPEAEPNAVAGQGAPAAPGDDASAQTPSSGDSPGSDTASLILGAAGIGEGTSAARRALLPNGGACEDPVAGTWRAQKFRAGDRTWVRFTLRVRRTGEQLEGTITSRIWRGRASDPSPGPCTAFGFDHTWRMPARGRFGEGVMSFRARSVRLIAEHCPSRDSRYAPDHFTGTVHELRQVFDATNNDGAFDVDEPYTFRRIACQ